MIQVLVRGGIINSRLSKTNFSKGRFQLKLLDSGNLVLNSRHVALDFAYAPYYSSGTDDPSNISNSGDQLIYDATGYMYVLRRNGLRFDLSLRDASPPSGNYYLRATLDPDGVLTQYSYTKNSTSNASWEEIWKSGNICSLIDGIDGSRACGFNSVCSPYTDRPNCECPQGFSLLDPNDPYGDCKPDFTPSCDESGANNWEGYDFVELTDINWPFSDYMRIKAVSKQDCKNYCAQDCFCAVAIHGGIDCWLKMLPLSNGRKVRDGTKALLKFRKGDPPPQSDPRFSGENKDQRSLIIVGPVLLSTVAVVIVIMSAVLCVTFYIIYKKNTINSNPARIYVDTNLPCFTYQELVEATNGFKDELGKGTSRVVYKGVIGTKTVAVKKLDRVFQDSERELQTEVNAIALTHHINLVQLLGYCNDGDQRLLIYEYMSNGTMAMFLFGDMRPNWKQRSYIALGVAKGLAYLHEECSTQVIHCDIKPQNILLDDVLNAKISDFGLAKILMMNQSRTSTGIRGTKGYVAPEWFRNGPVTTKVDVYSFGVVLLEIISCQKCVRESQSGDENGVILTDWAWDCYQEGRLDVLVGNDLQALDDYKKLTMFVMVSLWCVQENPLLRPTMRKVIQMLDGVVEVSDPPCPFPFSVTYSQ